MIFCSKKEKKKKKEMIIFLNLFLSLVCIVQRKEIEWGPFNLFLWWLIANWRFNMAIWLPSSNRARVHMINRQGGIRCQTTIQLSPIVLENLEPLLKPLGAILIFIKPRERTSSTCDSRVCGKCQFGAVPSLLLVLRGFSFQWFASNKHCIRQ